MAQHQDFSHSRGFTSSSSSARECNVFLRCYISLDFLQ
uniref:Uncharacterized protein n=1 Tax=Arundo donax TaxID=35708 RepID=A0A0A9GE05_ARUDO